MTEAMVKGSVGQRAMQKGQTIAEAMLDVTVLVILDCSGSMDDSVTRKWIGENTRTKKQVAAVELERIQADNPGKVGLVCFADRVEFVPEGQPIYVGCQTNMLDALKFVKDADGLIRLILVSDGEPSYCSTDDVLKLASKFRHGIDTIYIGPESDPGADLMRQIADVSHGKYGGARDVLRLGESIKLLSAGGLA